LLVLALVALEDRTTCTENNSYIKSLKFDF